MFSVPGWSITAESLVHESSTVSDVKKPQNVKSQVDSTDQSLKRKRHQSKVTNSRKITADELENLWAARTQGDGSKLKVSDGIDLTTTRKQSEKTKKKNDLNKPAAEKSTPDHSYGGKQRLETLKHKTASSQKPKQNEAQQNRVDGAESKEQSHDKKPSRTVEKNLGESNGENNVSTQQANDQIRQIPPPAPSTTKLTPLQAKMRNKLNAARFRHLNETLYTTSSTTAFELFNTSPDLFAEYHTGFQQQVKDSWPQNPVNNYINAIKTRGKMTEQEDSSTNSTQPLPRRKTGTCVIADLGCGDAPLARGCQSQIKALKLKFHNFDLHSPNSLVTKADISNLPLKDGETDIAIFCLSLMGTNWINFVEEAWRILRGDGKGEVWVSEVKSRFGRVTRTPTASLATDKPGNTKNKIGVTQQKSQNLEDEEDDFFSEDENQKGKVDETDVTKFVQVFQRRGFSLVPNSVNKSNKMFVSMVFLKSEIPKVGKYMGSRGNTYDKFNQQNKQGEMKYSKHKRADKDVDPKDEAKVLKPCVYKVR